MCSIKVHILHLRSTRCGYLAVAAATAAAAAPSLAADAREAPLAPNSTPPLAIYVRRCYGTGRKRQLW